MIVCPYDIIWIEGGFDKPNVDNSVLSKSIPSLINSIFFFLILKPLEPYPYGLNFKSSSCGKFEIKVYVHNTI